MAQEQATGAHTSTELSFLPKLGIGFAALLLLYAGLSSSTLMGPGIGASSGGIFGPDATLLAPATLAFSIWTVIYLGLFGCAVLVWFPDSRSNERRRTGVWPAAMSMLLNMLWITAAMRGIVWATIPLVLAVLASVIMLLERVRGRRAAGPAAAIIVEGTFGLYLGWLLVASAANVMAVVRHGGSNPAGAASQALAVILLLVVIAAAVAASIRYPRLWGIPIAVCWALIWIIRQRTHGALSSPLIAGLAFAGAVAVTLAFVWPLMRGSAPQVRAADGAASLANVPRTGR